ncbi:hypothetical protein OA48_25820 [Klebsiella variicola]|nr:hypothetical protein OA48_25820 [Klebsiella variicola]
MCWARRECRKTFGIETFTFYSNRYGPLPGLRYPIISCIKHHWIQHDETHALSPVNNIPKLITLEQSGNIFHNKDISARSLNNIHVRLPKSSSVITFTIFVQKAETLAWRPTNYNISFRYFV